VLDALDKENDLYYCPAGITMPFKWIQKEKHLDDNYNTIYMIS
jgi:hypothetical protein